MATYTTKIRFGGNNAPWRDFNPLTILIEPVAGETVQVLDGTTLKFGKSATVHEGQITFSDDGKKFTGSIRTGTGGAVDYKGALHGTPLAE